MTLSGKPRRQPLALTPEPKASGQVYLSLDVRFADGTTMQFHGRAIPALVRFLFEQICPLPPPLRGDDDQYS